MPTYVSLLRAVNLAGKNKVPMAELRPLFGTLGHTDVRTYIQSGNVVSQHDEPDPRVLERDAAAAIEQRFGFPVPVIVRTPDQLREALDHDPYVEVADHKRVAYVFLSAAPEPAKLGSIDPDGYAPDVFTVRGREVYVHYPDGVHRSKLTHALFERRFGVYATARNRRTVEQLLKLSQG
ncbi:MAG: DUF1697 domain-containing protein [Micromonosporaceae bacterium]